MTALRARAGLAGVRTPPRSVARMRRAAVSAPIRRHAGSRAVAVAVEPGMAPRLHVRAVAQSWLDVELGRRSIGQIAPLFIPELLLELRQVPAEVLRHPDASGTASTVRRARIVGSSVAGLDAVVTVRRGQRDGVLALTLRRDDLLVTGLWLPGHLCLEPSTAEPPVDEEDLWDPETELSWERRGTS